ncbi:arsenic resistance protein [Ectothiorhodospiraceae bacterium 2226]|nr:arsenic resistance protein [Ectothiorhodospiraceae bacterium 2226]
MNRLTLERRQVWIYLVAIGAGLLLGARWPGLGPVLEVVLWPTLALLLYLTFLQVPLWHVRDALRDRRFLGAALLGNFVLLPALVWALVQWLPPDPALRLGVLLVLLVPCTDWFMAFAQLGKGDAPRALAVTPLNLVLQIALLPLYLWWIAGETLQAALAAGPVAAAALVVLTPLVLAALTERWIDAMPARRAWRARARAWPVPLLALVVFLIAGAQVDAVAGTLGVLPAVLPVFLAFLLAAALLARLLQRALHLPAAHGRTLAFSFGTRNSFVVLPLALALPAGWEVAGVVIVLQALVELFGMLLYLRAIPWLIR